MEDIVRFRDASKVIAFMIQEFGRTNLFPRENYEFYARITGRTLRVDENWQFTFHVPSVAISYQPTIHIRAPHRGVLEGITLVLGLKIHLLPRHRSKLKACGVALEQDDRAEG
uniref:Uncharacterized protein n=1 Tax=Romanomermis culicivorax TaxID=13658 RepID=A0A915HXE6_ROMCU